MTARKLVVIGGDAAGMSAASLAKRRDPELDIEVFEMGVHTSYGACGMPYYVAGDILDINELVVVTPDEFREKRGIKVFMRHRVERIDPAAKTVEVLDLETNQAKTVSYDDLMIATGAEPLVPKGIDTSLPGVFTLRGLPDAEAIHHYINTKRCQQGIIVGGGYIGLEMAEALGRSGIDITVLVRGSRVMRPYEEEVSEAVQKHLESQGATVLGNSEAASVEQTEDNRISLTTTSGETLTADIVIIGAGVRPRSRLAEEAGLELGAKKAIKVDQRQQTSDPHIWSAGDCAEAYHVLLKKNAYIPLALTANRAGRVAGLNIVGTPTEFPGILGTAVCKVFDLTVARTGLGMKEAEETGLDVVKVVVTSRSKPHYYPGSAPVQTVLIVEKGTQKLWGAQMTGVDGVAHRINTFAAALAAGMNLKEIHALDLAYAPPFSPVWDPVLISCEVAMKKVK